MGVSTSTQLPGGNQSGLEKDLVPLPEAPTYLWNAEPRVILANNSDYIVSYWVLEESKKRTKAQQERIARSIALHLNASKITGNNVAEDLQRLKEEEALAKAEEQDDVAYYLTKDHRMGRKGSTQPTRIPFPAGCHHVRVYGLYEKNGEWHLYKDKVYSIALRNRNFRVTASTPKMRACFDPNNGPKNVRASK